MIKIALFSLLPLIANAFPVTQSWNRAASKFHTPSPSLITSRLSESDDEVSFNGEKPLQRRRAILSTFIASAVTAIALPASQALAAEETFTSIAERAKVLSRSIEQAEIQKEATIIKPPASSYSTKNAYDFTLPVSEVDIPFRDLIKQSVLEDGASKVKAILVVNIKQDDVIARKDIAEMVSLAAKYGQYGLAIISVPTDQGYFEPDTSTLIRMKLKTEYNYGASTPGLILTDKVNVLGTGAHPFMRWLQGSCRTPTGLGKVQANFEKFLIDGATGLPLRRYPRKYDPNEISPDIERLLASSVTASGGKIPPPSGNFYEEWRGAVNDAEVDTYRFQKGLNVFDE